MKKQYWIYHIPGKKIGMTRNLKKRVEEQQGYQSHEYDIILSTDDIDIVSKAEIELQKIFGYRVDRQLYKDLYKNNFKQLNNMNINITEQTTTFPCPINKLKGQLMDNVGMRWETEHGECVLTSESINWIMSNVQTSKYNNQRCYVYNKAFARYFDNNNAYSKNGTLTGGLAPTGMKERCNEGECLNPTHFDLIRTWADERGLYDKGDTKTQYLKLMEEAGELGRAILKNDEAEFIDAIGDMVVVLTNLARLGDTSIELCIDQAYDVISKRTGKMVNGTFVKDTL